MQRFQKPTQHDKDGNIWLWFNYSQSQAIRRPSKRLLIVQFTGFGSYESLLNRAAPISQMYAKAWGHDLLVMWGITKRLKRQKNQTLPAHQSMYNKVDYLLMALEKREQYDQILILDSDSMIYDFSADLTELIRGDDDMLVALKTHEEDLPTTHRINAGVTLWNLNHPLTWQLAMDWDEGCVEAIKKNYSLRGDQYFLVEALKKANRTAAVRAVQKEFHYRSASVIKHFIRTDSCSWEGSSLDGRVAEMQNASSEVVNRFQLDLSTMVFRNPTALIDPPPLPNDGPQPSALEFEPEWSEPETAFDDLEYKEDTPNCSTRKDPEWEFHEFGGERSPRQGKKKLLVAQFTAFGRNDRYLNMTSPINKIYARKWGHDFVMLRGAAFKTPFDGSCELPWKRSIYNRVALLSRALRNRDVYDHILIMHDGALFADFNFDVQTLLDVDTILVATRANKCDVTHTARLKTEITLWNLNHTKSEAILQSFFRQVGSDLKEAKERNTTARGDEICLRRAIQRQNMKQHVKSTVEEFNGLVIQKFAHAYPDLWSTNGLNITGGKIKNAIAELRARFPDDCANMTT
ncbi:unnamed protein product [Cylindrotheca closterium]|uniref:Nucleotide-diphospho-sugar transferase domain-containing protein n=1 Tax=Cylindrotheca closterium TaxID=2856 RepID=A0AAD2CE78_9STRA|nr:unnamed protein product [Cylindrotheca closterium]